MSSYIKFLSNFNACVVINNKKNICSENKITIKHIGIHNKNVLEHKYSMTEFGERERNHSHCWHTKL